ncbi:MAG: sugar nucleotide-binding protein [Bdellovibrionota bacterium]|jgi:dTDP-4-dehydrorhamnose reductase|nr:sugar nucleotide-binding protein [Bdellovibrionota bacterium]
MSKSKKEKEISKEKLLEELEANTKKTVLIFGVSSFIGSNLAEFLKKDYRVIGTYHKNSVRINGVLTIPCDVLAKEEVQLMFFAFKPDYVIYCAGISSIEECHLKEEKADALNTSGLFNVAEYCQRYKAQVCYLSSGFIFSGEKKNYFEMDIPDGFTTYGKTQAAAEFYIQKTSLNYLIFRCCRLYGRSIIPTRPTWFENLQRLLAKNKGAQMDDYIHTGFLDVYYLGMLIRMSFESGVSNRLFQVSSEDIGSLYQFAQNYGEVFNIAKDRFSKGRWPFPYHQSATTTSVEEQLYFKLDTANIEGFLNVNLPSIRESIEFTYQRFGGTPGHKKVGGGGDGVKFI